MKSYFSHLVLALGMAIIVLIGYGFWYAALSSKSVAAATMEGRIIAQTEAMDHIASARAVLAEIVGDEESVERHFISETEVVAFIDRLEEQGKAQGAAIDVLSVSAGTTSAQPTFIFALSLAGTFDSVMRTIGTIEYAPYALSVSGLSLIRNEKGHWRADLKIAVGSARTKTKTP